MVSEDLSAVQASLIERWVGKTGIESKTAEG